MWRIVAILLTYFVAQIATAIVGSALADGKTETARAVALGEASLMVNVALVGILLACGLTARRLPANRPPFFTAATAVALLAALALTFGGNGLSFLLGADDDGTTDLFRAMMGSPLCLLSLAVAGPVAEEAVFRAGLIPAMTRAGLNRWAAAALAALAFALVHGNAAQGIPALLTGLLLGAFYVVTGDVRLSVAAHVAVNSMGLASYALSDGSDTAVPTPEAFALMLTGLGAAAALVVWWWKLTHKKQGNCLHAS